MSRDRASGLALIAGAAASLVIMALHPTGRELYAAAGRSSVPAMVNVFVHSLAIASTPVMFFGALAVNRRFSSNDDALPTLAIVLWGFAMVAVALAATASGLIAPGLIHHVTEGGDDAAGLRDVLTYNSHLNQAFARIHVGMSSAAILFWSIAILRTRALPVRIGWYGALVAPVLLILLFAGLRMTIHGFGLVMVLQAVWLIVTGLHLARTAEPGR